MKLNLLCLAALLPLAMAASRPFDGNSRCKVQGFKVAPSMVEPCCLKNMGGSDRQNRILHCKLPIRREGLFRKCVYDLGYATVVDCDYYDN
ncbi:hypothetical protein BG015_004556 [Linnemannia schmuckeri]|uniref:Uncharacterized protein n=1 Tax=Linnemannia schmuckeri TaxID=64567 RepID=A0A9P5RCV0_9FUNG|nr:hypothetical protein BG015_004556 [Linnemannia schmuckeri]